jgi:quercetin dioxygenase-like cupin family protein
MNPSKEEFMRFVVRSLLALGFALSIAAPAPAADSKAPAKKPAWTIWAAPDIKFADVEGMAPAQSAALWGDMKKGAYGTMMKWPSGFVTPWHTHSHPVRAVVSQGTFTIELEGQPVRELGPGSYLYDPGKSRHKSGCKAGGAECVFLITQNAAFDFLADEKK